MSRRLRFRRSTGAAGSAPASRRGAVVVLIAASIVALMAAVALAVDYGFLLVVRGELQRAADAAALAGAMELVDDEALSGQPGMVDEAALARQKAVEYAGRHTAGGSPIVAEANPSNDPAGDVVIGHLTRPDDLAESLSLDGTLAPNSVRVTLRRDRARGNPVGLFFARVVGLAAADVSATATASLIGGIRGFKVTADSGNASLMPFAVWIESWNEAIVQGGGGDAYRYDPATGRVEVAADGIRELSLYPLDLFSGDSEGGGEPLPSGNFGTVDIGGEDNSTAVLQRQIASGITAEDLAYHGGQLAFNAEGYLTLTGDTGISGGMKDALTAIVGQTRIIALFDTVNQSGNNAVYRIVRFVGVRILHVRLTGALKHRKIVIQPANVIDAATIADAEGPSEYIYHPVCLVR